MREVILNSLTEKGFNTIKNNVADDSKETIVNKMLFNKMGFKREITIEDNHITIKFIIGNIYFQNVLSDKTFNGMIEEKLKDCIIDIDYNIQVVE
jgi:hypothetical protein